MNKDHRIWRTYNDCWIRVVGQQTMSARTHNRPCLQGHVADHVSKDVWEIYVSRPHQQGRVADHISKDVWQTMSVRTHGRPC
jgi:hypothetical protein